MRGRHLYGSFVALLFFFSAFISFVTPPFQSPDEMDHVKRAYLLSKGQILLQRGHDNASGGLIDSGLTAYMTLFTDYLTRPSVKLSKETLDAAESVQWSGKRVFIPATGTAYYFPAIYLPQAIGMALGKRLHLSVDASYKLARFAALSASAFALLFAFRLHPPAPIVLALLIVPMTLFQMSAASLDGISTSVSILALSLFAKIVISRERADPRLLYALALTIFLVASSRAHLLPMVLLLFGAAWYARSKRGYAISVLVSLSLVTWTLATIALTQGTKDIGASKGQIVQFYASDPAALLRVIRNTFSNDYIQWFYARSFFGILGWLDTPLPDQIYSYLYALVGTLFLISVSPRKLRGNWTARALLLTGCVTSVLLIELALLIQWTPHPAVHVDGVQGRYFLVPVIMGCYALTLTSDDEPVSRLRIAAVAVVLVALGLLSVFSSSTALVRRFYVQDERVELAAAGSTASEHIFGELTAGRTFTQTFRAEEVYLSQIKLLLATFARENSSTFEVAVVNGDGNRIFEAQIPARMVQDNRWRVIRTGGVALKKGAEYAIMLRSVDGSPGNSITWYASGADAYANGTAIVDAVQQERDFAFELTYLRTSAAPLTPQQ